MRLRMSATVAAAVLVMGVALPALADQASAIQAVRAQRFVTDAQVDNSGNMYVFVKPDTVAADDFAVHLCKVVVPHQGRIFRVRIIDVSKANLTQPSKGWPRLADAACVTVTK